MASSHAEDSRPIAEISQGPSAFESFLDRNQKLLLVLGIVVALAVIAWVVVRGIHRSAETNAGNALAAAAGLAELQDVVKDHSGTIAAGSARILISEEQWRNGQQDAAIDTLRTFLAETPEHPAAATARASLAARLMQQGKNEEAESLFRQVSEDPAARFLAPYALTCLGDLAKAAGRIDEAGELYRRAKDDFDSNPFSNSVQQHLDLLKFKLPEEIEPPPAEEAKEDAPEDGASSLPGELQGNPLRDILETTPPAMEESPAVEESAEPADGDSN